MASKETDAIAKRLMGARRAVVQSTDGVIRTGMLRPGASMLIVEPAADDVDLIAWSENHRPIIDELWLRHGALLFRGFAISEAERFERFALNLCSGLFRENGEHPRQSVGGGVYTPVFYPPQLRLLWHNENSFNLQWPMKIMFACAKPAVTGGGTPVVDSRRVYDHMPANIRERFASKRIMYVRNYGGGLGLHWTDVFQTTSKEEVEAQCRRTGVEYEWKGEDRLRTCCVRPAVIRHPLSGEVVWFGQPQHWHVSCLDEQTRKSLQRAFAEEDWPRHCYYGDGSPIGDEEMRAILEVYGELEERFTWAQGDVLALDNLLMAHGREAYSGERKLFVAMGEMGSF